MPKASIIVPAFNATRTLPQTMATLTTQSFRDSEIIIVDDGSTDQTTEMAHKYARHPGIRLVQQANRGLAGARNSGIHAARGEFIGFCDADDLWQQDKLATHIAHLEADPSIGLSYSGSLLITANGERTRHAQRPRLNGITAAHVMKRNPVGNGSAAVMRRGALEQLAYRPASEKQRDWVFDETFRQSEDIECWLRLALTTDWQIEGVPGALTHYRVNPGGLSANTERQLASWERVMDKLRPLNPTLFAQHEPAARAYQLRYLARRAVSDLDGTTARKMAHASLALSKRPLIEEPAKTLVTLAAAHGVTLLGNARLRHLSKLLSAPQS
ncbi:MAG: glycosyltransferase family 2 protein [Thalassovita sp.]